MLSMEFKPTEESINFNIEVDVPKFDPVPLALSLQT